MLNRNKLYDMLTDEKNPAWRNFSNNAEFLHLANYIADNYDQSEDLNDGVYMELFAVKDGVRYNSKIVNIRENIVVYIMTGQNAVESI
jgi:hypothetical protein